MGVFMIFGGVGIWLSGQIGALAEPLGILAVYRGIAAATAITAVAMLLSRKQVMSLLAD